MRTRIVRTERGAALMAGSGLAAFFIFLELLKAQRASQWAGLLPRDVAGLAIAFVVYAAVLIAVFSAIRRLLKRISGDPSRALHDAVALLLSGVVVWSLLSVHREHAPTPDDAIVGAALVLFSAALAFARGRNGYSARALGALLAGSLLSGIAALASAGEYFLFDPARARAVTLYPVAWLAVFTAMLVVTWVVSRRVREVVLVATIGIAVPPIATGFLLHAPERSAEDPRPNLVFMVADTLRADYCSAYGGPVPTPNLERIASAGTRFERSYALAPWTLPSMTGLLTSQYPRSLTPGSGHGVWSLQMNQYEVDTREPTLPMRLEAAGYATGAMTANAFLPAIPGMMAGIQTRASSHPILLLEGGYLSALPFLGALLQAWCPPLADLRPHNTTRDIDHYARAFIKRHRDRPFFLWIHYIDPHAPYDPPETLRRVHEGPWPFFHPYAGGEQWNLPILGKDFFVNEADRKYVKSLYEGEVAYIDRFVGRVRDTLAAAGITEATYFCLTSDHGEELWDHGEWGHGQSLYEEQLRVPLMFTGPGIHVRTVPESVSAIDLIPTLADLMGLPPSPSWRGESLAPVLKGEAAAPPAKPVFAQGTTNKTETPFHTVIVGAYKLIETAGTGEAVLFDLAADPGERRNLATELPGKTEELRKLLADWIASFPAFFETEPVDFNHDLEQGLEGMGYL